VEAPWLTVLTLSKEGACSSPKGTITPAPAIDGVLMRAKRYAMNCAAGPRQCPNRFRLFEVIRKPEITKKW